MVRYILTKAEKNISDTRVKSEKANNKSGIIIIILFCLSKYCYFSFKHTISEQSRESG